jgi:hypothetical protein
VSQTAGYGDLQQEKQLRNEIVIVLIRMLELYPSAAVLYRVLGLQDSISMYLTYFELGHAKDNLPDSFFMVSHLNEDKRER